MVRNPLPPDYDQETAGVGETIHFLQQLRSSQVQLARSVCCSQERTSLLEKRIVVTQRIYHALSAERAAKVDSDSGNSANIQTSRNNRAPVKENTLIRLGVHTGLTLLFALLRQDLDKGDGALCVDVLKNAMEIIAVLPALTLATESREHNLAHDALRKIFDFLEGILLKTEQPTEDMAVYSAGLSMAISG